MSVQNNGAKKLGDYANLGIVAGSALAAFGGAYSASSVLWALGNLDSKYSNPIALLFMALGSFLFPWVPIFISVVGQLSSKAKLFKLVAAGAVILGLTAKLLSTIVNVIDGNDRFDFVYEVFGIKVSDSASWGLNDYLSGLAYKLGVYVAFAAAIIVVIQFIRTRAPRAPRAYAPAPAAAKFDPMTGAPLAPQAPAAPVANFDPMTGKPIKPGK